MRVRVSERRRLAIASVLLLAACTLSLVKSVRTAGDANSTILPTHLDSASLSQLRDFLPPAGVVGYIDDGSGSPAALQNYYLAQYELAPLVVTRSPHAPLVVGYLPRSASDWPDGLVPIHDFGGGLLLFAQKHTLLARRGR